MEREIVRAMMICICGDCVLAVNRGWKPACGHPHVMAQQPYSQNRIVDLSSAPPKFCPFPQVSFVKEIVAYEDPISGD